jgi:acetyltransferase (GNAT) family protein
MDLVAAREVFDRTWRAERPPAAGVDRTWFDGILRITQGDRHFIDWWDFAPDRMAAIVAREAARVRSLDGELGWLVYGHDRPEGLGRALADAGFEDLFGLEKFLAIEASVAAKVERPPGVDVRQVRTEEDLASYAGVLRAAFGEEDWTTNDFYLPRLHDPTLVLLVAYVDGEPAATGRLEMPKETPFALLGDGGVVPQYRGAGLYRAIVADRAVEAVRQGARYLCVNAWETSRPTLERLGFEPLTTRHVWTLKAPSPS